MLLVGKKAPEFTAPAVVKGKTILQNNTLRSLAGNLSEIILFFYPKDFTFVCPTELLLFQKKIEDFHKKGVAVIGCSTDTEETHLAWLQTPIAKGGIQGVTYPLIADTAKTISANFGVLGGEWSYEEESDKVSFEGLPIAYRGTFFIDKDDIIRYQAINDLPLGRNIDEMLRIVDMWHHIQQNGEVCPANWVKGEGGIQPSQQGIATYLATTTL